MPVLRNVSLPANHYGSPTTQVLISVLPTPLLRARPSPCILIRLSEKQGSLLLMRIVILARIVQMVRHDFVFVSDSSARKRRYRPKSTLP